MKVPEEIRKVERPVNTVVFNTGSHGPKQYPVRAHVGWRYPEGKKPQPQFGPIIGYIAGNRFVPKVKMSDVEIPSTASYGAAALIHSVSGDVYEDLQSVFALGEACTIMSTAAAKVLRPKAPTDRISSIYRSSFLQIFYPGAAISGKTIRNLYQKIGENDPRRSAFFGLRLKRTLCDHLAVDGMLKEDNSVVNDLSAYSRKSRVKNTKDISILCAFDIEKMEPVCAKVFPGNRVDTSAYPEFIRENNIRDAILIDDTGFSVSSIRKELKDRPDLHYLTPLKRNDKRVVDNGMLVFDQVLLSEKDVVYARKEKIGDHKYLYSFCNTREANIEFTGFGQHAKKKGNGVIEPVDYAKKRDFSGIIVFESDLDLPCEVVYRCYRKRWLIETTFRYYKDDLDLDTTNVQTDYSVIGSEFVNFIATVITCRILEKADHAGVLDNTTYGELIEDLGQARRKTDAPLDQLPMSHDAYWSCAAEYDYHLMEALGLAQPEPKPEHRHPGRPSKKNSQAQNDEVSQTAASPSRLAPAENASEPAHTVEKRPVGRPRIHPLPDPDAPKRPVGRPRIHPLPGPDAPKRPVGRPRTRPLPDPDAPKRPVGRPRIHPVPDPNAPKRPVGRPRKTPLVDGKIP